MKALQQLAGSRKVDYRPVWFLLSGSLALAGRDESAVCDKDMENECGVQYSTGETLMNWSGTHSHTPNKVYEPKNAQEVLRLLNFLHNHKIQARPIGTALSPNGIGLHSTHAISLSALDSIEVNQKSQLVTVGAGARVSDVLKELDKHGLTLSNFSSIQEQQIAGWTQVAAHGTGATLPTVEEMIVRMKLATPTEGLLTLQTPDPNHPRLTDDLFSFAKAGLGCLGVVTELTLQCIPKLTLQEKMHTTEVDKLRQDHYRLLSEYRHVRYMWLPYTPTVAVVISNPIRSDSTSASKNEHETSFATSTMAELLIQNYSTKEISHDPIEIRALSFSQLRDRLLDLAPLDVEHVKRVNKAEAEYWQRASGSRVGDSTGILGFDCGGEQFVFEVCFPMGTLQQKTYKDVEFVEKILQLIEKYQIPAPCPIEQRWTARSAAKMSPAYSSNPDEIFSWVGIIMYLPPSQTAEQREEIERAFGGYVQALQKLLIEYNAQIHWAKIELPRENVVSYEAVRPNWLGWGEEKKFTAQEMLTERKKAIASKYDIQGYNAYRQALDPHEVLVNDLIQKLIVDNK